MTTAKTAADTRSSPAIEQAVNEVKKLIEQQEWVKAETMLGEALSSQPNDLKLLGMESLVAYCQGRWWEAENACRRALALNDNNAKLWNRLGETCREQGKWHEAESAFQAALKHDAGYTPAQSNIALLRLTQNRVDEAKKLAEEVLTRAPEDATALRVMAAIYLRHYELEKADQMLSGVLSRLPNYVDGLLLLAQLRHVEGRKHEAAKLVDQVLEIRPNMAEAHVRKAILNLSYQEYEAAYVAAKRATELKDFLPEAFLALGGAYLGKTDILEAKKAYEKAIELEPGLAEAHARLGLIYASMRKQEEAVGEIKKALLIETKQAHLYEIEATIMQMLGNATEAITAIEKALELNPKHVPSLMRYAILLLESRQMDKADKVYDRVLEEDPHHGEALFRKALIANFKLEYIDAWNYLAKSIFANPEARQPRVQYIKVLRSIRVGNEFSKEHAFAVSQCIDDPSLSNRNLSMPWLAFILNDLSLARISSLYQVENYEAAASMLDEHRESPAFSHPFFLKGVTNLIIPKYSFELMVGYLRRYALEHLTDDPSRWGWAKLLTALARQHFLVEYIGEESETETQAIEVLGNTLNEKSPLADILVYGCYRMLANHPHAAAISTRLHAEGDHDLKALANFQIDQVLEEREIAKTIETIGDVEDDVSKEVQNQYEENPYPRWGSLTVGTPGKFGQRVGRAFPSLHSETIPTPSPLKILIPGCGTGNQSSNTALFFEDSEVLAVDLSKASLSYAIRRAKEAGIDNITYRQADILDLPKHLDEKFDYIECTGVLHHMREPKQGFKALLEMLKPEGFLCAAVYSEIARQPVVAAREFIAEHGFEATPQGIRACRKALLNLPEDHPASKILNMGRDFFSMSDCRDLIFHVQEHRYTLPELKALFDELGLEFIGFFGLQGLLLKEYDKMFNDDPTRVNLDNWHKYEQANPQTFASMYHCWLRRKKS